MVEVRSLAVDAATRRSRDGDLPPQATGALADAPACRQCGDTLTLQTVTSTGVRGHGTPGVADRYPTYDEHVRCAGCDARGALVRERQTERIVRKLGPAVAPPRPPHEVIRHAR